MKFQIGDQVKFLNERGGGVISGIISSNLVNVMIEDGFEIPTAVSELIRVPDKEVENIAVSEGTARDIILPVESGQDQRNSPLFRKQDLEQYEKGIYIAFVPHDQKWLITGDLDIFLINYSSFDLIYNIHLKDTKGRYVGKDYDVSGPFSKSLLETIKRDELSAWIRGNIQLMFHVNQAEKLHPPADVEFRINPGRLLKEDQYLSSKFLNEKAFLYSLKTLSVNAEAEADEKDLPTTQKKQREDTNDADRPDYQHPEIKDSTEVDLHIHALKDDYKDLQPNEILNIQLDHFTKSLENAIIKKIPRVVFIHGGGKGVLKAEIIKRLNDYEGVHYFDASLAKYGTGAIEVLIKRTE